jgi:hypothetical protein
LPPPPQQQHPPRFFTGTTPSSAATTAASSSTPCWGWIRRETSCPRGRSTGRWPAPSASRSPSARAGATPRPAGCSWSRRPGCNAPLSSAEPRRSLAVPGGEVVIAGEPPGDCTSLSDRSRASPTTDHGLELLGPEPRQQARGSARPGLDGEGWGTTLPREPRTSTTSSRPRHVGMLSLARPSEKVERAVAHLARHLERRRHDEHLLLLATRLPTPQPARTQQRGTPGTPDVRCGIAHISIVRCLRILNSKGSSITSPTSITQVRLRPAQRCT